MNSKPQVILSPYQVELNAILTVRSANDPFNEIDYVITDESGRLIRKGAIAKGISEFKLCIVVFKTGVYRLTIGHTIEKFTVMLGSFPPVGGTSKLSLTQDDIPEIQTSAIMMVINLFMVYVFLYFMCCS